MNRPTLGIVKQLLALIGASATLVGSVDAATCAPNANPNGSCENLAWSAGGITSKYTITAQGGSNHAVTASGTVGDFVNNGTLTGLNGSTGIAIQSAAAVTSITNNAMVDTANGITLSAGAYVGTITNAASAYLSGRVGFGIALLSNASVTNLINAGDISGANAGDAIRVASTASIGTITNEATGQIAATDTGHGINNQGTVGTINNFGILDSTFGYGIKNTGTIATLNNAQGSLAYNGSLPTNYNIVINPTTYGKMAVSGSGGSTTNFGIYPGASFGMGANTYAGVFSGIGISSVNASTQSGTYGGGLFRTNWTLAANASNPNQLDLTANTQALTPNTNTSSGNNLASAVIAGATGSNGTATTLVNGTTLAAAAQALTAQQADQLSSVHAEGYSSNMTIGLEQMAHITNTVMDRIHNPLSNRAGTSTAYEMDQGKYLWVDAAAVKGTVNSYDGLGGFGYNLYDAVIGGDILRDSSGGLGLYAGAGYTTMTEPAQVSQNFNTTNYYAGLYGGKYLPYNFKLSGALGYMYGETNASRNNPNVGLFTGGTANSNYGTNGAYGAFKFSRPFQATESLTLTPYIGASYSQLWMGQAKESGGNDFNYNISNATAYTTVTFVGGEFIMPLTGAVKNPMSLVGFYRFGYDWFANSAYAHSITANSSKFGSFNQIGADMGPALNLAGLGVQGNLTKRLSGRIGIVGSANTNGWQVGGGGELKWAL